jgi:hypothetical protein
MAGSYGVPEDRTFYVSLFSFTNAGKRTRLFCATFILKMPSFCQDGLGTNIGKTTQKETRFLTASRPLFGLLSDYFLLRCARKPPISPTFTTQKDCFAKTGSGQT